MAIRISLLLHSALVLFLGCSAHRPAALAVPVDDEVSQGREFVLAVANKMPMWDADAISKYERAEIATVKADIAAAQQEEDRGIFLEQLTRLHQDWDALVALDEMLKKESLI